MCAQIAQKIKIGAKIHAFGKAVFWKSLKSANMLICINIGKYPKISSKYFEFFMLQLVHTFDPTAILLLYLFIWIGNKSIVWDTSSSID